jgi:arylsulfatase
MDIFPTCLDAAGAKHPKKFNDFEVLPLEGVSLLPVMRDSKAIPEERVLCWERMGNAAVRQGNWKLVRGYGPAAADGDIASSGPRSGEWELYRVDTDPGETNNIAMQEPARAKSMAQLYETWVKRVGVVPREQIVEQMQPVKK